MHVVRLRVALAAAVVLAGIAGAGSAQAATSLHCQASPLRLTVAGQQTVEPITQGVTGDCATGQATPPADVPSLLRAKALIAETSFDAARPQGTASGGVAGASVLPTPEQLAQLPTNQAIDQLPNQTFAAPAPLDAALASAGLPTTLSLDLRDAVRAAVPQPGTAMLSADILKSNASITCDAGAPKLTGSSQIAGVKLVGRDVGLDRAVQQSVTLIDTQNIAPGSLDPSKVIIATPLDGIAQPLLDQVRAALAPALAALPPIALPASVLDAKLTPSEQLRGPGSLTQRSLHAELSAGGRPLLDGVFGEAMVSGSAGACAVAAQGAVAQQTLGCSDRKLVLVDVLRRGHRVKLLGYANRDYVGRRVAIRLRATGRVVTRLRVRQDGSFSGYAAAPPSAMLATHARANRVRYRAEIGRELSFPLKLQRRLLVSSLSSHKGKVIIKGRVVAPLTTPRATIRVIRRVSCHKVLLVARVKPRPNGTFTITVKAPRNAAAAEYRLTTQVREKRSNPRIYPTFTLPRGVALNTR
jgi:hypothetical protein